MSWNWKEPCEKYLVQTRCDGEVSVSMETPAKIIEMFGFTDCSGDEYEVFDVMSEFGSVVKLEYVPATSAPFNHHTFISSATGEVVFEGCSAEH